MINPSVTGIFDTQANAVTLNGIISGGGNLTKNGSGALTLNGANGYTGSTTINSGTVQLGNTTALGASGGNLTLIAGTLFLNGQSPTIGVLNGAAGTLITNGSSSVASTFTIGENNQATTYAGSFQNGSGSGGLTVALAPPISGTGSTLTLSGSSTFAILNVYGVNNTFSYLSTVISTGTMNLTNSIAIGDNWDATLVQNGGLINDAGNLLVGHGVSPAGPDGMFILNSGTTIVATNIQKWRGSNTGGIYLNGGVLETGAIFNGGNNQFGSLVGDDGVMNLFINGGTIENLANGGFLFADSVQGSQAARYELNVEIGSGATINTNGISTTSQRPLLDVTGSSSAGLLTINGGGTMILTGTGSFTGTTLLSGATLKISRDGNLGVAPGSVVGNQLDINNGTLNFSSMLTG